MANENKRQETLAEQKLREEYDKMKRAALHEPGKEDKPTLEENQYFSPASVGINKGRSVNSMVDDYVSKYGGMNSVASAIKPSEALVIAIMRTLESGAPVNNMGFYDEVNWHLQTLGNPSQQPLIIKNTLLKLLQKGSD